MNAEGRLTIFTLNNESTQQISTQIKCGLSLRHEENDFEFSHSHITASARDTLFCASCVRSIQNKHIWLFLLVVLLYPFTYTNGNWISQHSTKEEKWNTLVK